MICVSKGNVNLEGNSGDILAECLTLNHFIIQNVLLPVAEENGRTIVEEFERFMTPVFVLLKEELEREENEDTD